jgi:hypothetical protein
MEQILLNPLRKEELDALPLLELVARMDRVLEVNRLERYGREVLQLFDHKPTVAEFVATKLVSQATDNQRGLVYLFFGFLVQMELCEVATGISNKVLYNSSFHQTESWRSPAFRLRHGVLWQYDILASRVAMEVFMDLLHALDTGRRLAGRKSRFKEFRKWLINIENPFVYFANVLISAYRFDRKHRTAEAHGSSRFPRKLLLLQVPDSVELNESHKLSNVLLNTWSPLKVILNGGMPNFIHIVDGISEWLPVYLSGAPEEIERMLDEILSEMQSE